MPSEGENIQYLYLVLTHDGNPTIDWNVVGAALDLNKGAVTKRWSRLKTALEKGETPSGSAYQFLWLCLKHSQRTNPFNWVEIAQKCNTTAGAASKRYSRMKAAFEKGDSAPGSPAKTKTNRKSAIKDEIQAAEDVETSPNAKRKRTTVKANACTTDFDAHKPDADFDDEDAFNVKPKRAKSGKASPKPKGKDAIKQEDKDEDEDTFLDAQEVSDVTSGVVYAIPKEETDDMPLIFV